MSQITRCPACGTLFKVVADQLRISEGWVRCGHCADVFDAAAHLQADTGRLEADTAAGLTGARVARPEPAAPAPGQAAVAPEAAPESQVFASSLNTEFDDAVPFDAPDSAQLDAEAQALIEHPLDRPFELRRRDAGEIERPRALQAAFQPGPDSVADLETEPLLDEVSFVRDARRKTFWERPRLRAALLAAAVALGCLLALQVAVHDRDRLASASPGLGPWLARLCVPLNCRVGPPRQIDAIVIDSSSFNKLPGDGYRLNVTVKNQAGIAVAMPALELTLTDGQDQAVVRRVLMPAEIAPGAHVIAAASEWSGALALAVSANGMAARVAGYRLLAFYP